MIWGRLCYKEEECAVGIGWDELRIVTGTDALFGFQFLPSKFDEIDKCIIINPGKKALDSIIFVSQSVRSTLRPRTG